MYILKETEGIGAAGSLTEPTARPGFSVCLNISYSVGTLQGTLDEPLILWYPARLPSLYNCRLKAPRCPEELLATVTPCLAQQAWKVCEALGDLPRGSPAAVLRQNTATRVFSVGLAKSGFHSRP